MTMEFKEATQEQSKLRIAIEAPSGAGKTWTSLLLARALCKEYGMPEDSIGVIDTERGSASKYAGDFKFKTIQLLPPYTPERFIQAIEAAVRAGLFVLIADSGTHEWNGSGGILEIVDALIPKYHGNKWAAWSEATPRHQKFIDAITVANTHVIVTMRSKMETEQQEVNGRKEIVKLGMAAEQRAGFEYEYDIVAAMELVTHKLTITKSRCRPLDGYSEVAPDGGRLAHILHSWLSSGVERAVQPVLQNPAPAPAAPVPQAPSQQPVVERVSAADQAVIRTRNTVIAERKANPDSAVQKDAHERGERFRQAMNTAGFGKWSDLWAADPAGPGFAIVTTALGLVRNDQGELVDASAPDPTASGDDDPFADSAASESVESDRTGRTADPEPEQKPAPSAAPEEKRPGWFTPIQSKYEFWLSDNVGDGTWFLVQRPEDDKEWTTFKITTEGAVRRPLPQKFRVFNAARKYGEECYRAAVAVLKTQGGR